MIKNFLIAVSLMVFIIIYIYFILSCHKIENNCIEKTCQFSTDCNVLYYFNQFQH